MTSPTPRFLLVLATALAGGGLSSVCAQEARARADYEKIVRPVLQEFCYDCHGDGMDKGNFALDKHGDFAAAFKDKKFWDTVREHVDTHVMPPEGKPQPTNEQRSVLLRWIEDEVFWVDPAKPDPGHITLRRLNRVEYNNTVRDVFKVDTRPASTFPPDDAGYGYDNIGDVLSLSPLLMEKYLKAARQVSEAAIWVKTDARSVREKRAHQFEDKSEASDKLDDGSRSLYTNGDIATRLDIHTAGLWRAEVKVSASQAGGEKARFAVLVDGKAVKEFEVTADIRADEDKRWQRLHFDLELPKGSPEVAIRFLNDHYDESNPDPNKRDRNLFVDSLEVKGPLKLRTPEQSKLLDWLCDNRKLLPASLTVHGTDFDAGAGLMGMDSDRICLASNGHVQRSIEIPQDGTYRVRLAVSADQAGDDKARLRVQLGGQVLAENREITVKGPGEEQDWIFTPALKQGRHELRVEFLNDYGDDKANRNAYLFDVVIEATGGNLFQPDRSTLSKWIDGLATRTMRRPPNQEELQKLNDMANMVLGDGGTTLDALRLVTEALLVSPKFLFRGGAEPTGPVENGVALVDEFTLASRLSYFLWSSAPDEELLRLAMQGELRKNLRAQITRMIADWKGWALTENFAGQWLRLRDIELVAPNRRLYPQFEGGYAGEMKKESQLYFDHIYRGNRSALEFLDSDYTFVNEKLARYYELPVKVKGREFQKVSLTGTPRGGILTHGSILTLTSHPNRTSPVKRGQFLLENILGTPPPPAPQNVPAFREDRGARVEGTLRQRFEAHRANPSCASCHAFLDPMGFAFENYDAIGRWRDKDNGQPVDNSGKLLTGQQFIGAAELRKLLVQERRNEFTKCLVENMLIYALGRGLDYPDKPFVKEITKKAAEQEYRFQEIIAAVVESTPFQRMRVPAAPAKTDTAK